MKSAAASRRKRSHARPAAPPPPPDRWAWIARPWAPLAVFGAAFTVVMLFLALLPAKYAASEATDFEYFYDPVARRLLNGEGFVTPSGVAARYPPGYPIILAGLYTAADWFDLAYPAALRFFSAFCSAAAAAMLFAFGRWAFNPLAGLLSAALWITYPAALWVSKQPGSEGPFAVLLVALAWLGWYLLREGTLRWAPALALGVGLGALMLVRPIAIGLPVLAALGIFLLARDRDPQRRLIACSTLLVGTFVAILPWEALVRSQSGAWVPLSTGGAATMRDGLTFGVRDKGYRQGAFVPEGAREVMADLSKRYAELTSPGKIAGVLAEEFRKHPVGVTELMMIKAARSWYGTDSQRMEWPLLAIHAAYLAALGFALLRAFRLGGSLRTLAWCIGGVVVYFWAMTAISLPLVRYMTPMMTMSFFAMGAVFAAGKPCPDAKVGVL
ncbi:MAG: hypothetical protein U0Q16_28145 [Bryobacteraceae bacterium]